MKKCNQCGTLLPDEARFCTQCGAPQPAATGPSAGPRLDLGAELEPQLNQWFFRALGRRVGEEQPGADLQLYLERIHSSGFNETIRRRIGQLADKIRAGTVGRADHARINRLVGSTFDDLLDYFIIHHCRDINAIPLPETILKYQQADLKTVDLYRMILDYLDLEHEEEEVFLYPEFLAMPPEKLRNAGKNFLFPAKDERIFLICDQSLFGSCREGFALTEKALYWKAHLQKAQKAPYQSLHEITREKDWLTVNGEFFNVNPTFNVKIMKLLRRLQRLNG